ncbi:uncharacterized protein LOC142341872 isoform X2 [Convolutriloba macropyga]|uniref:uncharacterized protein LOC142341872 isoform X2 n=1 Tax=Convolutriloba macropyga TaxID=536237 RepID=UPI003F522036
MSCRSCLFLFSSCVYLISIFLGADCVLNGTYVNQRDYPFFVAILFTMENYDSFRAIMSSNATIYTCGGALMKGPDGIPMVVTALTCLLQVGLGYKNNNNNNNEVNADDVHMRYYFIRTEWDTSDINYGSYSPEGIRDKIRGSGRVYGTNSDNVVAIRNLTIRFSEEGKGQWRAENNLAFLFLHPYSKNLQDVALKECDEYEYGTNGRWGVRELYVLSIGHEDKSGKVGRGVQRQNVTTPFNHKYCIYAISRAYSASYAEVCSMGPALCDNDVGSPLILEVTDSHTGKKDQCLFGVYSYSLAEKVRRQVQDFIDYDYFSVDSCEDYSYSFYAIPQLYRQCYADEFSWQSWDVDWSQSQPDYPDYSLRRV